MRTCFSIFSFLSFLSFSYGQNLISNPGFENNGQLNCASWYDACKQELTYLCDTTIAGTVCDVKFQQDVPPGGGNWSMAITGVGNSPPATASTYITGQEGTSVYQLSAWMKDFGNGWGGINIGTRSKGMYTLSQTLRADSMEWAFFSLTDTLKLQPGDSIDITLWAFAAGPSFGDIGFDEIELSVIDTLTAVFDQSSFLPVQVTCYPNPAHHSLTINMNDQTGQFTIYCYSLSGQLIHSLQTTEKVVVLNTAGWNRGVYFFRVEQSGDRKLVGEGKFMVEK